MVSSVRAAMASTCERQDSSSWYMVLNACWTGGAAGEQAVVAHDQRVVRPEVLDDALALVEIDRRSLVVVIADMADEADRGLRQRQQAAFHRRHRDAGAGVGVQHACDLRPRLVDRAVDHVAGLVDAVVGVGLPDDLALDVDLHQARGGDLLVEQAVEIDQQVILGAGNARGDVVVDQVGHPVRVDQPVAGGEIDAAPAIPPATPGRGST